MSLLQRQAAAIRKEHTIPDKPGTDLSKAPSLLFTLEQAKRHDQDAFSALALQGLAEVSALEPELAAFAPLFEGGMRDRATLTREENGRLDAEIRKMLLLLSPHMQTRAAQGCMDGLLARHHVHRWNVDDVMACVLPYHDSPLFTRLLQGMHVEGKPRWSWLQTLKAKPATLVRSAFAKYCAKDLSVLAFVGDAVQETAKMQKSNRALATFFAAAWLDTLTMAKSVGADLVNAALPTVLALLRSPHLGDMFHAALVVLGALCVKVDLGPAAQTQLFDRIARQVAGEHGRSAAASLVLMLQSQASAGVSTKARQTLSNVKPKALTRAMPSGMDCSNLSAVLLQSFLSHAASLPEGDEEAQRLQDMASALLLEAPCASCQVAVLAEAVLRAFSACAKGKPVGGPEFERVAEIFRKPVAELGANQPAALGAAFRKAADASAGGAGTEALVRLVAPAGEAVEADGSGGSLVPLIQAFAHSSAKTRVRAVQMAVEQMQEAAAEDADNPRQRLLASLVLQAVQDESPDVVEQALQLEAVWSSLPQVQPAAAFSVLDAALARMFGGAKAKGASAPEVASAVLLEDPQVARLAPLLLRSLTCLYGRAGCPKALKERIDAALLPVLVLCLVALDPAGGGGPLQAKAKDAKKLSKLQAAALEFCRASKHKLLGHFKAGTTGELGPFAASLGAGADEQAVAGLCAIVETGVWPEAPQGGQATSAPPRGEALGGAAAQCAAARCAEACQRLAWHQALAKGDAGAAGGLGDLLVAAVKAVAAAEQRRSGGSPKKSTRRQSKGSSSQASSLLASATGLLRVALERPQALTAGLQQALGLPIALLRPALLGLALAPASAAGPPGAGLTGAATANALLTLKSLAGAWELDQCLLAPLLARLAASRAAEVRAAAFLLLEAVSGAEVSSWDSPCAEALVEAGVLRGHRAVLPPGSWAAATAEQQVELAGMPKKALGAFRKHFASCKAEILRDCSATAPALRRFLALQGGAVPFWAVSLSMLQAPVAAEAPEIRAAVPAAAFVSEMGAPLQAAATEMLRQLKAGDAAARAPALLGLAAAAVAGIWKADKPDASAVKPAASFLKEVALPFCVGLAELLEGSAGQMRLPEGMEELVGEVCQSVAGTCAQKGAEALRPEASATLFRLGVAASLPRCEEEAEAKDEAPAGPPAVALAEACGTALVDLGLDAQLVSKLLADSPSLKAKQLGTPAGRAAADLLCQLVVVLALEDGGALALLAALGKAAQSAALKCEPSADAPSANALYHLLQAMAALSEQLGSHGASPAVRAAQAAQVQAVCGAVAELCTTSGAKVTSAMLAAVVRICGALAALCPQPGKPGSLKKAEKGALELESPPLLACVEALRAFQRPIGADVMTALKSHLPRLWRFPEASADAAAVPRQLAAFDMQAQARLRLLLHTAVAGCKVPHEAMGAPFCLSLARTAGVEASLDFAIVLYLSHACAPAAAGGKKPKQKRKSGAKKDAEIEELLPAQDLATADEALGMLRSAAGNSRYHCLSKLMLTLCACAHELRKTHLGAKGALSWRLALVPEALQQGADPAQALAVLDAGFVVASRFVSELGLPGDLDEGDVDTAGYDSVAGSADDDRDSSPALALCYAVWAACAADGFLDGLEGVADAKLVEQCRGHCREFRTLLLRSLAVNHPLTFFHAVCLVLQVPDRCPTVMAGDHLADAEFLSTVAACMMREAGDALKKRLQFHGGDDADEEAGGEVATLCGDLFASVMQHVSGHFLAGEGSALSKRSRLMCWRFLDSLCLFAGQAVPKPVLQFCFPLSARCLAARAGGDETFCVQEAIACCLCLKSAVEQLGRGLLEKLNEIVPPLFQLLGAQAEKGAMEEDEGEGVLLEQRALAVLLALVKSVGPFLSPFLPQYLLLTTSGGPAWKTPLLEELARALVAQVPFRILWPAVEAAVKTAAPGLRALPNKGAGAALDVGLLRLQRLSYQHVWILSGAPPETVAEGADAMCLSLLCLLATGAGAVGTFLRAGGQPQDVPARVLKRDLRKEALMPGGDLSWAEGCSEGGAGSLHGLAAAAFAQFALRLDLEEVRQHFVKVLAWARGSQQTTLALQCTRRPEEATALEDSESACRVLGLCEVMRGLEREAPGLAVQLLLPLTIPDLASCLTASRHCALRTGSRLRPSARKKRKASGGAARGDGAVLQGNTWWWLDVSAATLGFAREALRSAGDSTKAAKAVEEAVDALTEPCADQLDIFKYLPPVQESPAAQALGLAIQGAAVALAAASDSGRVKKVLTSILAKSRSEEVEVRVAAVRCCHKIWSELGVQVVSGLSEVVMYASELLEDEDSSVEEAVRAMIKTIEDCTGESLQDALKH